MTDDPALKTLLSRIEAVFSEDELRKKLEENRPLRIKLGVDPTRPDLTLGHAVVFNKLRQFQELGHEAILIIGDFTTLVGDPSGRSATRPQLGREEVAENARTYLEQAFRILDREKTVVRHNSEWFGKMGFEDVLALTRKMTVARMIERDDFAKRYAEGTPISIVEFIYPLMQGYDSVELRADVELGGHDQLFNMLVGRQLQKEAGQAEQVVICLPLLVGLDGVQKMSKSLGNYIAFNDPPRDMFGKVMSISDEIMWDYHRFLLNTDEPAVSALRERHPMEIKKELAEKLTARFHSPEAARCERERFEQVFSRHELPDDMPEYDWGQLSAQTETSLIELLGASGCLASKSEARRLVRQGAVKIDGTKETDPEARIPRPSGGMVIRAGKRVFFRVNG